MLRTQLVANCGRLCLEDSTIGALTIETEEAHDGRRWDGIKDVVEKMPVVNGVMRRIVPSMVAGELSLIAW